MKPWAVALLIGGGILLIKAKARAQVPLTKVGGLTTAFDPVYRAECPSIPVEYLRALAKYESDSNPAETDGGAWGLLQVWWQRPGSVLDEYNEKNSTSYRKEDLLDPYTNARLACSLLTRIAAYYRWAYARAFPRASWNDRRFVEVVTMGWNAGWSERSGVGRVIQVLLSEGHSTDIDVEMIAQRASSLGGVTSKLTRRAVVSFARRVTAAYIQQRSDS